jgi:methionine-rich copper-binding protein CopC
MSRPRPVPAERAASSVAKLALAVRVVAVSAVGAGLVACSGSAPPPSLPRQASILQRSSPAEGSVARAPVDSIKLEFAPPARLMEVTVTGGDQLTTPMMVTSSAETHRYEVPLPSLQPGAYSVAWRATVAGSAHQGVIRFSVR